MSALSASSPLRPQAPQRIGTSERRRTQKISKSALVLASPQESTAAQSAATGLSAGDSLAAAAAAAAKLSAPALNGEVCAAAPLVDDSYAYVSNGQPLTLDGSRAIALFSYASECPTDLNFPEGAVIKIIRRYSNGWWEGELNGLIGDFPCNYVAEVDEEDSEQSTTEVPVPQQPQQPPPPQSTASAERLSKVRALPLKQGWLVKKGHRRRNWKVRFFVLESDRLNYFASQSDVKPKGCIPLSQSTLVKVAPEMRRSNCFMISTNVKPFIYYVTASTGEEMVDWMAAINKTKSELPQ